MPNTTSRTIRQAPCPTCSKTVRWTAEARYRPFCSDRCRLIDLGEWASESFRIPAQESPTGIDGDLPTDDPQH